MNDSTHPGFLGGRKQNLGVPNRLSVRKQPVIEPYPICVDQRVYSLQGVLQLVRLLEVEGKGRYLLSERIRTVHRVRQRDDLVPRFKQALRDVAARVSECPCDCDTHGGLCRASELSDAGGPARPNWKLTRPALICSSDFVGRSNH